MTAAAAPLRGIPWPARFVALAAIWGLSFVFIKVGLDSFAPLQVATLRLAFGAATLVSLVALTGDRLPRARRTWGHLLFATIFMNVAPFALFVPTEHWVMEMAAQKGHDVDERRYMGKLGARWGEYA